MKKKSRQQKRREDRERAKSQTKIVRGERKLNIRWYFLIAMFVTLFFLAAVCQIVTGSAFPNTLYCAIFLGILSLVGWWGAILEYVAIKRYGYKMMQRMFGEAAITARARFLG